MNKIVSNALIKALNGITGTSKDAIIEFQNTAMTEYLAQILGISDFEVHTVTDERVFVKSCQYVYLQEFPVNPSGITLKNELLQAITGYTFQLEQSVGLDSTLLTIGSNGQPTFLPYDQVLMTYTAGWIVKDTYQVLDYAALVGKTIIVLDRSTGTETTYTFVASGATGNQINAATSNTVTAANIATALSGTSSGDTATLPLDKYVSSTTATSAQATVTNSNLPLNLKTAIALMCQFYLSEKDSVGNIKSYSIGSKSVDFRDTNSLNSFKSIIDRYVSFKKVNLYS